jgi:predicted metal-dependent peptidase
MTLTASEKIIRARVLLNNAHPFFARMTLLLKFTEDNRIGTMGVDNKGRCSYNKDFVLSLTDEQLMGVICHEVMHCALDHLDRRGSKHAGIWNISADLVDNHLLNQNNLKLPDGCLMPYNDEYTLKLPSGTEITIKDISKRGAESIYTEIHDKWIEDGGQDGEELGNNFDEHQFGDEKDGGNSGQDGEDIDGMSQRDSQFWKNKMVESAMASKMAGKYPAGMERWIDEITNPKLSWNKLLARFLRKNLPYDYSWRTPNKKAYATGIYLPRIEKEGVEITFLIDTSGSMSEKDLATCFGEINGIIKSNHGVSLRVVYHDTEVYEGSILTNPCQADIIKELHKIKGGGGTDFNTAYEWLEKNSKNADVIIHLSDGYDTFPKTFHRPLIICLQANGKKLEDVQKECPYATVVKIPEYQ